MLTVRNFFGNVLFISAFILALSLFCIPVGASQPDIGSMIDPEDRDIINITGFDSPSTDVRAIFLDRSEGLTLEELTARMPETLSVILNNGERIEAGVTWFPVGDDFDITKGYYYQFSPRLDENLYRLPDGFDIAASAPYVSVFISDEPLSASHKELNSSKSDSGEEAIASKEFFAYSSNSNEERIYSYLISELGMNSAAACGILSNLYCESGFRENALGDNGTSYGICQWHNSRWNNLKAFCDNNGFDWHSLDGQLHFMEYELNGTQSNVLRRMKSVSDDADGAFSAGYDWCYYYEVPANREEKSVTRANLARDSFWPIYGGNYEENPPEQEKKLKLSQSYMYLLVDGGSVKLSAAVVPESDDGGRIRFYAADGSENIISVSTDGVVKPLKKGTARVMVESSELNITASCKVTVVKNKPSEMVESQVKEVSSDTIKCLIGEKEGSFSVKVSYEDAISYQARKISPYDDLNADVDISSLTSFIDKQGLIRNGSYSAKDFIKINLKAKNDKEANKKAWFFPKLALNTTKAVKAGMTTQETEDLKSLLKELNSDLKSKKCSYTINPIDISDPDITIKLTINDDRLKSSGGSITNVNTLKIITDDNTFKPSADQYKLMLMDVNKNKAVLIGEKSFTGTVIVKVNR